MNDTKILVVDDDIEIAYAIQQLLINEGYTVLEAHNGLEALQLIDEQNIQLIIMDIMMPKLDGISALLKIRESKHVPIILLSAKSEQSDKVLGLSIGADDYITKPYDPAELVARVQSQLRRFLTFNTEKRVGGNCIIIGGLEMNLDTHDFYVDGQSVKLTVTEFKILEFLMSHPNIVFSAQRIYEQVWDEEAYASDNAVMVHVRRIREKIEYNPKEPKYLKVVWGVGYKIENN
ncbi:response regulator transcription factor [Culicoidibacter larvae]|uniref:Response regulator transcription factor n=1 Tax=Culicoidibacter larvae TaxID=2579976 RepID=A0A5R8QGV8_9FIRM|nr:response regulator transcription factor [Culicoidibacter larvae]TLG77245.1 response regulator transcription factor [Culicoidibacter larvae]